MVMLLLLLQLLLMLLQLLLLLLKQLLLASPSPLPTFLDVGRRRQRVVLVDRLGGYLPWRHVLWQKCNPDASIELH